MRTTKNRDEYCDGKWKKYRHTNEGKMLAGIFVVIVGGVLLARQMGVEFPTWLFTWPVFMITLGLYIGARHMFCNTGWLVPVIIGSIFLFDQQNPDISISMYIWPIVIILAGIVMIFKPRKRFKKYADAIVEDWEETKIREENVDNDFIETIAIFSGVKKNIISKNFKGGEIVCVLGGAEINLMQADFEGKVVLDITCVLGGAKLIIPSHWDVQPEIMAVMGGIEDKRQLPNGSVTNKVLILKGTTVLGGIEIKSF